MHMMHKNTWFLKLIQDCEFVIVIIQNLQKNNPFIFPKEDEHCLPLQK